MTKAGEYLRPQPSPEVLGSLTYDDLSRLAEIIPPAFSSTQPEELAVYIPLAIEADSADVLVSRNTAGMIASVMLVNVDFGAGKLRGRIDDVATHSDSLRQGHAGAVLDYALEWFGSKGVKRVALTSNDARGPAHRLYESRGFVIKGTNQFQLDLI